MNLINARKNLIIVRAGDKSLHPQWLCNEERSWDIVVSYYGDYPERYKGQYDYLHLYKGSKWEGISNFISQNRSLIDKYEYLWLPDDDLFTTTNNINDFFSLISQLKLTIAQPALTRYSYFSWDIVLQVPGTQYRVTDFVEIMAPCFRVETFACFEETLKENTSGWGFEWLWRYIAEKNDMMHFGIIDCTPVFHTRVVGSAGHGGSKLSPSEEMNKLFRRHDLTFSKPQVLRTYFMQPDSCIA